MSKSPESMDVDELLTRRMQFAKAVSDAKADLARLTHPDELKRYRNQQQLNDRRDSLLRERREFENKLRVYDAVLLLRDPERFPEDGWVEPDMILPSQEPLTSLEAVLEERQRLVKIYRRLQRIQRVRKTRYGRAQYMQEWFKGMKLALARVQARLGEIKAFLRQDREERSRRSLEELYNISDPLTSDPLELLRAANTLLLRLQTDLEGDFDEDEFAVINAIQTRVLAGVPAPALPQPANRPVLVPVDREAITANLKHYAHRAKHLNFERWFKRVMPVPPDDKPEPRVWCEGCRVHVVRPGSGKSLCAQCAKQVEVIPSLIHPPQPLLDQAEWFRYLSDFCAYWTTTSYGVKIGCVTNYRQALKLDEVTLDRYQLDPRIVLFQDSRTHHLAPHCVILPSADEADRFTQAFLLHVISQITHSWDF